MDERAAHGPGTLVATQLVVVFLVLALIAMVVVLGNAEIRWAAYAIGGLILCLGAMLFGIRRALTAYFILALSVDVHYYLTTPPPPLYIGMSGPSALTVPIALVPGILLLAMQRIVDRAERAPFAWVPEISRPVLWACLTTAAAILASNSLRFSGFCVLWENVGFYVLLLIVINTVRTREEVRRLSPLLQVALLGQYVAFLLQLVTGVKFDALGKADKVAQEGGTLLHSASGTVASTTAGFATFIEPIILLCYVEFRSREPGRGRTIAGVLFLLGVIVIALTLNRSSWIGLPIGLFTVETLLKRRHLAAGVSGAARRQLIGLAAVVLIFAAMFPMFQSTRQAKHEEDAQQRLNLMGPATTMISHHPILGVGPGAYAYHVREYAGGYKGWLYVVHNDWMLIWAERGTLGVFAWIVLMKSMGRIMNRATRVRDRRLAGFAIASFAGLIVHLWEISWSSVMAFSTYGIIYVLTGACLAILRIEASPEVQAESPILLAEAPARPSIAIAGRP